MPAQGCLCKGLVRQTFHASFFFLLIAVAATALTAAPEDVRPTEVARRRRDATRVVDVAVFLHKSRADVPPAFLGFTFDWNNGTLDASWAGADIIELDLGDPSLRRFASALSPAVLRIGGSLADVATYAVGEGYPPCPRETCLDMPLWHSLIDFAESCGLSLLFDLNIMLGRDSSTHDFDSSNIRALIEYTAKNGLPVWGFELGNEKQCELSPKETAQALEQVRAIIDEAWPSGTDNKKKPVLIGPAINPRPDWLQEMMEVGGGAAVDGVSYHSYSGWGRSETLPLLVAQPAWIDFPLGITQQHLQAVRNSGFAKMPLYISETALAWDSCKSGVCDAFISGFWYINMLANTATAGGKGVYRQTLTGGHYGLLDQLRGFRPRPDYWTALLWQRLTTTRWLYSHQNEPCTDCFAAHVRTYVSCAPWTIGDKSIHVGAGGAVTLVYSNTHKTQPLAFRGINYQNWSGYWTELAVTPRHEYILTAPKGNASSEGILLNGDLLKVAPDGSLPTIKPKVMGGQLVFPPQSYGFIVLPHAGAQACTVSEGFSGEKISNHHPETDNSSERMASNHPETDNSNGRMASNHPETDNSSERMASNHPETDNSSERRDVQLVAKIKVGVEGGIGGEDGGLATQ